MQCPALLRFRHCWQLSLTGRHARLKPPLPGVPVQSLGFWGPADLYLLEKVWHLGLTACFHDPLPLKQQNQNVGCSQIGPLSLTLCFHGLRLHLSPRHRPPA